MLLTLDMILERTKILEVTVADKTEEEGLLGGDLVLVTEVVRDVPSVLLELKHVLGSPVEVHVFTGVPHLHDALHLHVDTVIWVHLAVLAS